MDKAIVWENRVKLQGQGQKVKPYCIGRKVLSLEMHVLNMMTLLTGNVHIKSKSFTIMKGLTRREFISKL